MRFAREPFAGRIRIRHLALAAFLLIGCFGAGSYWESYYQHRGFVPPARLPYARPGHLETVHFYSPALGREADYLAYLPPGYSPAGRYPTFYLLHGSPGRPQLFVDAGNIDVRLDNLISKHKVPPMILVLPDGRVGGSSLSDSEWANARYGRYEGYVLDVVRDVDLRFAAIPDREDRVIGGYSEGGYGALNIALHHLRVFGAVQVWSGYFSQPNPAGAFAHATRATLAYNSPSDYVLAISHRLEALPLRVFIYAGRRDPAKILIAPMARELAARGADVGYGIYPGGHDWQLWTAHLDQMLIIVGRDVTRPLVPKPLTHARARPAAPRVLAPVPPIAVPRPVAVQARNTPGHARSLVVIIAGLLLALASAAAINLGFLLQHRGLGATRNLRGGHQALAVALLRNHSWLGGQALGWAGFGAQIVAVSIAPLALVQSFAAGGLALSVPLAAGVFGHRISREQRLAVALVAIALAALPIGLGLRADHLEAGRLAMTTAMVLALALAVAAPAAPALRAVAAGLFYGVADAAIKAIAVLWRAHGAGALNSGWTILAAGATFAGFLCFQSALRRGSAVASISLMNCLAALVALASGLLAFGESLGRGSSVTVGHLLAVFVVLACVPVLAAAQSELADTIEPRDATRNRAARSEQRGLKPRPYAGLAGEDYVAKALIARHRERELRGEQQQDQGQRGSRQSSQQTGQPDKRQPSHNAGG